MTKIQAYDPGTWGYYTNDLNGKVMEGFQPNEPNIDDICGEYKIIFATSYMPLLIHHDDDDEEDEDEKSALFHWHVRRKVSGSLIVVRHPLTPADHAPIAYCAKAVLFSGDTGPIHGQFGHGYNAFGFAGNVVRAGTEEDLFKGCCNCLPMKCLGMTGRGHLYVVSERKAFPMVQREKEEDEDEDDNPVDFGEFPKSGAAAASTAATKRAQRIYNTRHYSFLCRELGLTCVVSTLITQYIGNDILPKPDDYPPFFYAEPGDLWMGGPLTHNTHHHDGSHETQTSRSFLLARKLKDTEKHVQTQIIANMSSETARFGYIVVPPKEVAPLVTWMYLHPGDEEPPPALTEIIDVLQSLDHPHRHRHRGDTASRRTVRSNHPHPVTDGNEGYPEGVVTRSRARRNREETQRVLRPRRVKVCYRT